MSKRSFPKAAIAAMLVAGFLLLSGCGTAKAPMAPGSSSGILSPGGAAHMTFSPQTAQRASKPGKLVAVEGTGLYSLSTSGMFYPDAAGQLNLRFPKYTTDDDTQIQVKSATLEVVGGAIPTATTIGMTVFSGTALSDVAIDFSPTGLSFVPEATLTIVVWGDLDPSTVTVYHIEGASITQITPALVEGKKTWTIIVKIPGFSQYSVGDDWVPETMPPPPPPDPPTP